VFQIPISAEQPGKEYQMIKAHVFLDEKMVFMGRMQHAPRVGETIRVTIKDVAVYGVITEVIWCIDEEDREGQRVNIRAEKDGK
jgi:hypothetical protein